MSVVLVAFGCGEKFYAAPLPSAEAGAAGAEAGEGGALVTGGSAGELSGGASGGGRPGGGAPQVAGVGGMLPLAGGGSGGVGGSGGAGGAPPISEQGLELWLDAFVGVQQESGAISEWQDRSPHARHAFQDDAHRQPLLVAQALNGKPSIVFDGEDDFLELPTLPSDFKAGVTIFVVGRTESDEQCMAYFEASNGPEEDDVHLGFYQAQYLYEVADPYLLVQVEQVLKTPEVVVGLHRPSGAVQVRRNGTLLGTSQFDLPKLTPRERVYVGYTEYAGCTVLKGRISELLLYSRALSSSEVGQVEGYLQQKWACCTE